MKKKTINNDTIRDFINDFYNIKLQDSSRELHVAKARAFYYYMCFKYSNDIVTAKQVAISINKKQHGTVGIHLDTVEEMAIYDKFNFKRYQALESAFLDKYSPFISKNDFKLNTRNELYLKQRLKKSNKINLGYREKIRKLQLDLGKAYQQINDIK